MWNIAARANKILDEGKVKFTLYSLSHKNYLFSLFDYLTKENYYCLRVVDNTTLKLGRLYLDFINSILRDIDTPDFFAEVPIPVGIGAVKEECRTICKKLSPELSEIIKKYEARLQLRSTVNDHSDILTAIDNAEVEIAYFEELYKNNSQPTADNSIPLKSLLEHLRDFDCQKILELINGLIKYHTGKISSEDKTNIEYIYSPRHSGNYETELVYLTGQIDGSVLFKPVNDNEEAIGRLNTYLGITETLTAKATALQQWLINFIDRQLTIKLSQHSSTTEMADALQSTLPHLSFTSEQYCKCFKQLSFLEDVESITLFLSDKEKANDTFYVYLSKKLRDTLERINSIEMRERILNAERIITEHVKALVGLEIEAFTSACDKEFTTLPISTAKGRTSGFAHRKAYAFKKD